MMTAATPMLSNARTNVACASVDISVCRPVIRDQRAQRVGNLYVVSRTAPQYPDTAIHTARYDRVQQALQRNDITPEPAGKVTRRVPARR
jgi:hypothetical protein